MSCSLRHGHVTLTDYSSSAYASSAFSFEFASQDSKLTHNKFDLLYEGDWFSVNMVGGDESYIVDLGAMSLKGVPAMVDPDNYAVGEWGKHDAIEAQLAHTYFVRTIDAAGKRVAAFHVEGLEPGRRVTIEWIRSTDADAMIPPTDCF
jgi:hypothetical protein